MIVLYVGTQLAASLITMVGGDKNQQRIMLALPFVFVPFIATFEAGLILYWVTTNFWTDRPAAGGPQALPEARSIEKELGKASPAAARARARPTVAAAVADGGNGKSASASAPPPKSPRKKKKRSGRRR